MRLAIEYDGADHRGQRRARRDLVREAALVALGWKILRFDADVVLFRPDRVAAEVRAELVARAGLAAEDQRVARAERVGRVG